MRNRGTVGWERKRAGDEKFVCMCVHMCVCVCMCVCVFGKYLHKTVNLRSVQRFISVCGCM